MRGGISTVVIITFFFIISIFANDQDASESLPKDDKSCVVVNFEKHIKDVTAFNNVMDIAVHSGIWKRALASVDPFMINNQSLDPLKISQMGIAYEITPFIEELNVTGLQTIIPWHMNVTAPNILQIGGEVTRTMTINSTIVLNIKQLNHKWWQPCWTDVWQGQRCVPAVVTVDMSVEVVKPRANLTVFASMVECPQNSLGNRRECKDVVLKDLLTAMMFGNLHEFTQRLLLRMQQLAVMKVMVDFERILRLDTHFRTSSSLVNAPANYLTKMCSVRAINKKQWCYQDLVTLTEYLVEVLVNSHINHQLAPQFGSTCYDNGTAPERDAALVIGDYGDDEDDSSPYSSS